MLTPLAHGLVGRTDLPVPESVFIGAAAAVLVLSFLALAVLWQSPRLEDGRDRPVGRFPLALEILLGCLGVAFFALVVHAGLAGTQTAAANLAPTTIFIVFWVGIPVLSLLVGDVFRLLSPWRAIGRATGFLLRGRLPAPMPYPEALGVWPAIVGLVAFGWVELVWGGRDDPSKLVIAALVYFAAMLIGQALYGVEQWSRRGDAFGVYFGLFARLAPFVRRDGVLHVRRPLSGLAEDAPPAGWVLLVTAAIGITVFDGLSEGPVWSDVVDDVVSVFTALGFSARTALSLAFTTGLVACVLLIGGLYRIGADAVGRADSARLFAHTLVPIAAAYVVAHYFSLLAYGGQGMIFLLSDPLGDGSDLLGTASRQIDYSWISATGIWYVQVGSLVLGHVAGLLLAHDRALVLTEGVRDATRSQLVMLLLMVCFTVLGLWLLSEANG